MKTIIHTSESRGQADHGWLKARHSFSFANYYNPERVHFGVLRVLNDDTVAPGMGFGKHPHDNMEIITIPLEGDLEHQDSMGNRAVIKSGDVQVMSAGTGVFHSEYNPNRDRQTKLLQIWLFPNKRDVQPRYDQITLDADKLSRGLTQVLSPNPDDEGVWIHQDAWFHMGDLKAGQTETYTWRKPGNGAYVFVISGSVKIGDATLKERDAMGISETDSITLEMLNPGRVLIMEFPMN